MIIDYKGCEPTIGNNVFVAPDAWIIGDVTLAENVSIFFGAVLRGDILPIKIGARSNIQEHCVLHTQTNTVPTVVGNDVTVGHRVTLHSCTIKDRCLIGMGSIIMDRAVVGEDCIVAAGTLITIGKEIPPRSLVMGSPGKVVRALTEEEVGGIAATAQRYVEKGNWYRQKLSQSSA